MSGKKSPAKLKMPGHESYAVLSTRPLHILFFLLPLIILYELGSFFYLVDATHGVVKTIAARSLMARFFELFGASSLHLPAVVLVVVLLLWHWLLKDKSTIKPAVLGGMLLESILWTMPLLVLGLLLWSQPAAVAQVDPAPADPNIGAAASLHQISWQARLTLSIGAGLYEELLFRLVIITLVHFLVADVVRQRQGAAYVCAAVISAILFGLYHDTRLPGGGADLRLLGFYVGAGLYFAVLFIFRGFGIVVGAHALFDVVTLVLIPASHGKT